MSARWTVSLILFLAVLVGLFLRSCDGSADEGSWPIEPVNSDHPIANTFGEILLGKFYDARMLNYQWMGYQHPGVDILAEPFPDSDAPFAVVTIAGKVDEFLMNPIGAANFILIVSPEGVRYQYLHLESASVHPDTMVTFNQGGNLKSRDRIAKVYDAFPCEADHLHYDVARDTGNGTLSWINPLSNIEPTPDLLSPTIYDEIRLGRHGSDPWEVFEPGVTQYACTTVSGLVDIVVKVGDRDDAGSPNVFAGNVGVHDLKWKACKEANPSCSAWNSTHRYDAMSGEWSDAPVPDIGKRFSFGTPWTTKAEPWTAEPGSECPAEDISETYMIATTANGGPSWNTADPKYPNGRYLLTVQTTDIAGNVATRERLVCVANEVP